MTELEVEIELVISTFFAKWKRQMKVAMVIAKVLIHFQDKGIKLPEDEAAQHLYSLISKGGFQTYGDITNWRHSEIVPKIYLNQSN